MVRIQDGLFNLFYLLDGELARLRQYFGDRGALDLAEGTLEDLRDDLGPLAGGASVDRLYAPESEYQLAVLAHSLLDAGHLSYAAWAYSFAMGIASDRDSLTHSAAEAALLYALTGQQRELQNVRIRYAACDSRPEHLAECDHLLAGVRLVQGRTRETEALLGDSRDEEARILRVLAGCHDADQEQLERVRPQLRASEMPPVFRSFGRYAELLGALCAHDLLAADQAYQAVMADPLGDDRPIGFFWEAYLGWVPAASDVLFALISEGEGTASEVFRAGVHDAHNVYLRGSLWGFGAGLFAHQPVLSAHARYHAARDFSFLALQGADEKILALSKFGGLWRAGLP